MSLKSTLDFRLNILSFSLHFFLCLHRCMPRELLPKLNLFLLTCLSIFPCPTNSPVHNSFPLILEQTIHVWHHTILSSPHPRPEEINAGKFAPLLSSTEHSHNGPSSDLGQVWGCRYTSRIAEQHLPWLAKPTSSSSC